VTETCEAKVYVSTVLPGNVTIAVSPHYNTITESHRGVLCFQEKTPCLSLNTLKRFKTVLHHPEHLCTKDIQLTFWTEKKKTAAKIKGRYICVALVATHLTVF